MRRYLHHRSMVLVGILLYRNSFASYTYIKRFLKISNAKVIFYTPKKVKESYEKLLRINFDKPIQINQCKIYTVWVKLDCPDLYEGKYIGIIIHNYYIFGFSDIQYCENGTNI